MKKGINGVWVESLRDLINNGNMVAPRGMSTFEILQRTIEVNMRKCVLLIPERKLSYQYMAAEAWWILRGDNQVKTLAPYNKHISKYSDDGATFFGAYGPKIIGQLPHVIQALRRDRFTRQAGLTIWRENPPKSRDIPCTISIFVNIREGMLNVHVFMRSSDMWLGIPYDVFTFSMYGHMICKILNSYSEEFVQPGSLYLTAASSHLYASNFNQAVKVIQSNVIDEIDDGPDTPPEYFCASDGDSLTEMLGLLKDTKPGNPLRYWEP